MEVFQNFVDRSGYSYMIGNAGYSNTDGVRSYLYAYVRRHGREFASMLHFIFSLFITYRKSLDQLAITS